mmetsp:Transcript_21823/g.45555  ORF Transcript_21823/g.45555 Transcript_21823/m.45555 type:complete len:653 (-) Transcript_21823:94-2052(-)
MRSTCLGTVALIALTSPFGSSFVVNRNGLTSTTSCRSSSHLFYTEKDSSAQDALERTAAHLEKLRKMKKPVASEGDETSSSFWNEEGGRLKQNYLMQSANSLKEELKRRKLPRSGRKPDLARRLAEDDLKQSSDPSEVDAEEDSDASTAEWLQSALEAAVEDHSFVSVPSFAGIPLSEAAGTALGRAGFNQPTPIQSIAIPSIAKGESVVIHSETGSGKSLAYLLPITEKYWSIMRSHKRPEHRALILTPTRELAAQVAGVASVLAPPGTVRLVARPTNLMSDGSKDRGEGEFGGRADPGDTQPLIFVGSAKAIMQSLYGDGRMPASPTKKPEAMAFLQSVRYLALDEVDRLLNVKKARSDKINKKIHEKPAAVLSAAVERSTLGRAQIVAASATVGRPLRRELSRVLGLSPQECPRIIRATDEVNIDEDGAINQEPQPQPKQQHGRSVTIPDSVENFIFPVEGSSEGKLLTGTFQLIQQLGKKPRRMLVVLSRSFGMSTQNAIGALKHFKLTPEPQALLDVLEAEGTDQMIEIHRQVSGASGVGEATSQYFQKAKEEEEEADTTSDEQYLFVTGEDTVRGLHLDGLEVVIVVGRPNGPDEYTHIAGRTGRAGRSGKVFNVVSQENGAALKSWEGMLHVDFTKISAEQAADL